MSTRDAPTQSYQPASTEHSVLCQQTYQSTQYYQQCIEISREVCLQEMHLLNLINLHLQNTVCYVNRLINLLSIIDNVLKYSVSIFFGSTPDVGQSQQWVVRIWPSSFPDRVVI
jgi:hypothetical protein